MQTGFLCSVSLALLTITASYFDWESWCHAPTHTHPSCPRTSVALSEHGNHRSRGGACDAFLVQGSRVVATQGVLNARLKAPLDGGEGA